MKVSSAILIQSKSDRIWESGLSGAFGMEKKGKDRLAYRLRLLQ